MEFHAVQQLYRLFALLNGDEGRAKDRLKRGQLNARGQHGPVLPKVLVFRLRRRLQPMGMVVSGVVHNPAIEKHMPRPWLGAAR
jgi:hypothetical protein